jgi:LmbE family N-acetylglucosaminyl deacetylase
MSERSLPRLMGIWAHPDDEAFGTAGSMARATAAGHAVAIVCATRGEVGKIADPSLATPETLGQVREGELRNACAAVGVTDVSFLDYIDGQVQEADEEEALGRITRHLRRFRPDVILTFAANGGYGHVDHMAVHRLVLVAIAAAADATRFPAQMVEGLAPHRVRKVYYTSFPRARMRQMIEQARAAGGDFSPGGDAATIPIEEMGTPDELITTHILLSDAEFAAKQHAMAAHATQMPADSPWSRATPEQFREFMGVESFQLSAPPLSDRLYPMPEDDLFAGL